jgi:hypothetical protein
LAFFLLSNHFFDHALSSVTVIQLQHAWKSHAIKPEEMASEMKDKLKIILMIFNLKIEGKKTFKA